MMKISHGRFLLSIVCILSFCISLSAKQPDFLNLLLDNEDISTLSVAQEENIAIDPEISDFWAEDIEDEGESDDVIPSPCALLDLLFADTDASTVFHNKNEKYYRGQWTAIGLEYVDDDIYDPNLSDEALALRAIDQNKLTAYEKDVVNNYYRLVKQYYESPWYMKFISKKVGYGIFAAADIEQGQLIGEYTGVIYDEECAKNQSHRDSRYSWNIQPPSYLQDGLRFYVDAHISCNFARMINHSYEPNVMPVTMHGPDGSRMLYVACKKIKKDEQLLVNYGEGYWSQRGQPEDLN